MAKKKVKYYIPHTPVTMKSEKTSTTTLENGHYLLRLNIHISCNPAIPLLSKYPRRVCTYVPKDVQNVHSSTIPDSPKLAINKLVINNAYQQ